MLELIVNRTDEEIANAKLGEQYVHWQCTKCNFERPVQLNDLILTTQCPRCTKHGA